MDSCGLNSGKSGNSFAPVHVVATMTRAFYRVRAHTREEPAKLEFAGLESLKGRTGPLSPPLLVRPARAQDRT